MEPLECGGLRAILLEALDQAVQQGRRRADRVRRMLRHGAREVRRVVDTVAERVGSSVPDAERLAAGQQQTHEGDQTEGAELEREPAGKLSEKICQRSVIRSAPCGPAAGRVQNATALQAIANIL